MGAHASPCVQWSQQSCVSHVAFPGTPDFLSLLAFLLGGFLTEYYMFCFFSHLLSSTAEVSSSGRGEEEAF